jgi:hypothetical protein
MIARKNFQNLVMYFLAAHAACRPFKHVESPSLRVELLEYLSFSSHGLAASVDRHSIVSSLVRLLGYAIEKQTHLFVLISSYSVQVFVSPLLLCCSLIAPLRALAVANLARRKARLVRLVPYNPYSSTNFTLSRNFFVCLRVERPFL